MKKARIFASLAVMLCSLVLSVTAEIVLPGGFSPPPGFTVDANRSKFFDYDRLPLSYKKPGTSQTVQIELFGKAWHLNLKVQPPNKISDATDAAMRGALSAQGWELMTPSGRLVARRSTSGGERWFSGTAESGYFRAIILEPIPPPHPLALASPAEAPESFGERDDFPYLGRFPGAILIRTEMRPNDAMEVTPSGSPERTMAGPPLVIKRYQPAPSTSPYEYMVAYRDALINAGWTVTLAAAGGDAAVIAHYAKNGRDIFCSLHGDWIKVADVGAQNESAKLADGLARDGHVPVAGIYFDIDKSTLKAESETALRHVLDLLKKNAALALEVQGHTDNTGAEDRNRVLSEARAASVVRWLTEHGVDGGRLALKGYGATRPVAENATPEGRARNRRVELAKKG